MHHWAIEYIGRPYEAAARGPEKVDCYGLIWLIYKEKFNLELPLFPGISHLQPVECCRKIADNLQEDWIRIEEPFDGCLVAMSRGKEVHHIGIYAIASYGSGRIVHCYHLTQTVVADTLRGLRLRGLSKILYYRHRLWPTS